MSVDLVSQIGSIVFDLMLLSWVTTFVLLVVILVMHFLMPGPVLYKYFKPPYFREAELHLFRGVPYAPVRTIMFMRAIAYPKSGKARGITAAADLVPSWYKTASKVVVISIYINGALLLLGIVGGGAFYFLDA